MDTLETGKGVRVKSVVEGSAAAEVGIRQRRHHRKNCGAGGERVL